MFDGLRIGQHTQGDSVLDDQLLIAHSALCGGSCRHLPFAVMHADQGVLPFSSLIALWYLDSRIGVLFRFNPRVSPSTDVDQCHRHATSSLG